MPIKMKVCNVADYNESLKKRGRIFYLFDEAAKVWLYNAVNKKKGAKYTYSNRLIEILATFRYLFKYPYRQLEGLLEEYAARNNLKLPIPDFTTLCRRMAKLSSTIKDHRNKNEIAASGCVDVLIDSTGINIYHTSSSRSNDNGYVRPYKHLDQVRKMHVALNPESKTVLSMKMSKGNIVDSDIVPTLLKGISCSVNSVCADRAYDRMKVRNECFIRNAKQIIPPKRDAVIRRPKKGEPTGLWEERNAAIHFISRYRDREEGRKKWQENNGYGRRSLIEAFFGKFKTIFGFHFMSKSEQARESELMIKVNMLNSYNQLGRAYFKRAA